MKFMRRSDREISALEATRIVENAEYGVMSTVDREGQPYGVPLSFVYRDGCIYFHATVSGHKLDNIALNPRVSFCVVGRTRVLPDKFGTEYESAILFGNAVEVAGTEKHDALLWLLEKYCVDYIEEGREYIEQKDPVTKVFRIAVDRISGKART